MRIKDKVEECLKKFPEARDNDKFLIACIYALYYPHLIFLHEGKKAMTLNNLLNMPSTESIRRVRQKFQSEGLYMASDSARAMRGQNESIMKEEMVKPSEDVNI